jgi:1-acyl-sn-glycerol-3-phosphate acyltransferase
MRFLTRLRFKDLPYWMTRWTILIFLKLFCGLKYRRREMIPQDSCIIASNHVSYYDPLSVGLGTAGKLGYIAKEELYENKIMGTFLKILASIPINREGVDKSAIKKALGYLSADTYVGIFPEGTRSQDGELQEGKNGAALLSVLSGKPIVPAAIIGTKDVKFFKFPPKMNRIIVLYGHPIYPDQFEGSKKEKIEKITEHLLEAIRELKKELEIIWEQ